MDIHIILWYFILQTRISDIKKYIQYYRNILSITLFIIIFIVFPENNKHNLRNFKIVEIHYLYEDYNLLPMFNQLP